MTFIKYVPPPTYVSEIEWLRQIKEAAEKLVTLTKEDKSNTRGFSFHEYPCIFDVYEVARSNKTDGYGVEDFEDKADRIEADQDRYIKIHDDCDRLWYLLSWTPAEKGNQE